MRRIRVVADEPSARATDMRQHSRFSFRHISSIQVSNRLSGEPMGYVADLSLGGLRLVASQPLAVGGCYEMVLHVPEHGERVRQIEVVVICQWSRATRGATASRWASPSTGRRPSSPPWWRSRHRGGASSTEARGRHQPSVPRMFTPTRSGISFCDSTCSPG